MGGLEKGPGETSNSVCEAVVNGQGMGEGGGIQQVKTHCVQKDKIKQMLPFPFH